MKHKHNMDTKCAYGLNKVNDNIIGYYIIKSIISDIGKINYGCIIPFLFRTPFATNITIIENGVDKSNGYETKFGEFVKYGSNCVHGYFCGVC
jgi:hypothetical protein